jgi:thiamine-monophosphate kinase
VALRTTAVTGSDCPQGLETLANLGESELIRRLGAFAPAGQFADDAALLSAGGEGALVVNTDVLVEGLHFSEATTAAADVGWRAAAANLSDLAAMGCTEVVGLTVGLVAPAVTPWAWVEGVYGGLRAALDTYGGVLLGGDCSGGAQRILAVTAIGRLGACLSPAGDHAADQAVESGTSATATEPGSSAWAVIRRGDGRPGDRLVCTGTHGLSRLGLALLQGDIAAEPAALLDPDLRERAIAAHRRPLPRFDAVRALIGCRPAAFPWRVGGCDSSDGLAAAAAAIAASSGCSARLERIALPLDPAMAGLPNAEAWCLGGGEDFELVLAMAPTWAEALLEVLPSSARIGELVAGPAGNLGWSDGRPWPEHSSGIGGFQHFG